jgi:hypothetical protein
MRDFRYCTLPETGLKRHPAWRRWEAEPPSPLPPLTPRAQPQWSPWSTPPPPLPKPPPWRTGTRRQGLFGPAIDNLSAFQTFFGDSQAFSGVLGILPTNFKDVGFSCRFFGTVGNCISIIHQALPAVLTHALHQRRHHLGPRRHLRMVLSIHAQLPQVRRCIHRRAAAQLAIVTTC